MEAKFYIIEKCGQWYLNRNNPHRWDVDTVMSDKSSLIEWAEWKYGVKVIGENEGRIYLN